MGLGGPAGDLDCREIWKPCPRKVLLLPHVICRPPPAGILSKTRQSGVSTTSKPLDMSVVITTYNRARSLPGALESLMDQEMDSGRYEIIVVDNNSTDDTRRVIERCMGKRPRGTDLFEPGQGVSYGRNTGIAAAPA